MYTLTERAQVRVGDRVMMLPAKVLSESSTGVSLGEQTVSAGGRVNVVVRYTKRVEELRQNVTNRSLQLTRTRPGTLYTLVSAEPSPDRRWLMLVADRSA